MITLFTPAIVIHSFLKPVAELPAISLKPARPGQALGDAKAQAVLPIADGVGQPHVIEAGVASQIAVLDGGEEGFLFG
jgi:hypothetical protein